MPARRRIRGVAALEFAFVSIAFIFLLYGIATFGAALYTRQVVSRAAEDGVRAALMYNNVTANDSRVQNVVYQSLASSLIAPMNVSTNAATRLAWLRATVASPEVNISAPGQVVVRVVYPYRANPVLPAIPLSQAWMPNLLTGRATAARP
ncbi:MAG: pilus assembly protein [Comamonadaceae bacterium]|nr:MAG: pilus assembly protein [Comamonadaceae bacterium]